MAPSRTKRRSRRAVSDEDEDIEEPAPSSQPSRIVDEDDAEGETGGVSQALAQTNGAQHSQEDDEDEPIFDPASFQDVSLDPGLAVQKIKAFVGDYDVLTARIQNSLGLFTGVAVTLEETRDIEEEEADSKSDPSAAMVEEAMREILDVRAEVAIQQKVLNDMSEHLKTHRAMENAEEKFEKALKKELNKYRTQTARQKYGESEAYELFRQSIWEVNHKDEPRPPIRTLIEKEDDDSSDGSDIEVGGATQNFTCQITLQPFVDPMTSRVCKHSFSRKPLQDLFKAAGGGKTKCPAPGCNKELSLADFRLNEELAKRAAAAAKRERRRKAVDDDEGGDDVV